MSAVSRDSRIQQLIRNLVSRQRTYQNSNPLSDFVSAFLRNNNNSRMLFVVLHILDVQPLEINSIVSQDTSAHRYRELKLFEVSVAER